MPEGPPWEDGPERPILIGGCPRSGTTLLGSMLGSHPDLVAVPETQFIGEVLREMGAGPGTVDPARALDAVLGHWQLRGWELELGASTRETLSSATGYSEVLRGLVASYARQVGRGGARVWVDHTPTNARDLPLLLELFPEARFVHILRDGRAVAASVVPLDWGPSTVLGAAHYWMEHVAHGLAGEGSTAGQRGARVSFEALVEAPEDTLAEVCRSLGLSADPVHEMVAGDGLEVPAYTRHQHGLVGQRPDPARIHAWRDELTDREVEVFEAVTGGLLAQLGYEPVHGPSARGPTLLEIARWTAQEGLRRVGNRLRFRAHVRETVPERGA